MSDDDAPAEGEADDPRERLESRLDDLEEALETAETEADLDEIEEDLDSVEEEIEAADLPEPDEEEEDAEDPRAELESRLSDLRDELAAQRGPYAEDVIETVEGVQSTVADTRWTDAGTPDVQAAIDEFLATAGDALDRDLPESEGDTEPLAAELDVVVDAIEDADLDADEDAETIATLVEAAEALETGVEEAEEWDDLETREQLQAEGFYDVLGHYKDYPPEWSALKEHEQQGNVEMVLLALDSLDSDFMERHCLEAITRMGDAGAFDEMYSRAQKRDRPSIKALGKMGDGAEDAVETLVEYVDTDSDPQLQKVTFKALGEIGHEAAVQPLANKLTMDNDNVRPYAARALGLIGDTRAVDPLADTLADDENDTVRAAAAWALRQIGTRNALEAAAEYTDERSFLVQTEAEKAQAALDEAAVEA